MESPVSNSDSFEEPSTVESNESPDTPGGDGKEQIVTKNGWIKRHWPGVKHLDDEEAALERQRLHERRQQLKRNYLAAQLPQKKVCMMNLTERRAHNRKTVAARKAKMTAEAKGEQRKKERERKRRTRGVETPEEKAARQLKDREHKRKIRRSLTDEQREEVKRKEAMRKQELRHQRNNKCKDNVKNKSSTKHKRKSEVIVKNEKEDFNTSMMNATF